MSYKIRKNKKKSKNVEIKKNYESKKNKGRLIKK